MRDNTDRWVPGVGYVVGGSEQCTASLVPNLLELLAQVFPEPGRETINMSVSLPMGVIKIGD